MFVKTDTKTVDETPTILQNLPTPPGEEIKEKIKEGYQTDIGKEIFVLFIEKGLLTPKGEPTEKLLKMNFPHLTPSMVKEIYGEIWKEFDIFVDQYWIRYSIAQLILDYTAAVPNFPIQSYHLVGSYVIYTLIFKNKDYLRAFFKHNEIDFPEALYQKITAPLPNDIDIRLEINQFVQMSDLRNLGDWIFTNVAQEYAPRYVAKKLESEKIRYLFPDRIYPELSKSLECRPFDNGINKFLIVDFENSPIETVFSFCLATQQSFLLDDIFFPLKELISQPLLSESDLEKLTIYPQSHSKYGVYGFLLHLTKKCDVVDVRSLDFHNWFRLTHWYLKGYSSQKKGVESYLNGTITKSTSLNPHFIGHFVKECIDYMEKHCKQPSEKLAFFVNMLSLMKLHHSDFVIYSICEECKKYFHGIYKDFSPLSYGEESLYQIYELLFIDCLSFKTVVQLLQLFYFLAFTSKQPGIELIDHEDTIPLYQKKFQLRKEKEVYIALPISELTMELRLEDIRKIEKRLIRLFVFSHPEENYAPNPERMRKLEKTGIDCVGKSIVALTSHPHQFLSMLGWLISLRVPNSDETFQNNLLSFLDGGSILKSAALPYLADHFFHVSPQELRSMESNELILKLLHLCCFDEDDKKRSFGHFLLRQLCSQRTFQPLVKQFASEVEAKFNDRPEEISSLFIDLFNAKAVEFKDLFLVFFRFCQECQKSLKARDSKSFTKNGLMIFQAFIAQIKSHMHLVEFDEKNYAMLSWSIERLVEEKMVNIAEELLISAQNEQKIPLKSREITLSWGCVWHAQLKDGTPPATLFSLWKCRIEKGEIQAEFNHFILDLCSILKNTKQLETLYGLFDVLNDQKVAIPPEGRALLREEMVNYCKMKRKHFQGVYGNTIFENLSALEKLEIENNRIEELISENGTDKTSELLETQLQKSKESIKQFASEIEEKFNERPEEISLAFVKLFHSKTIEFKDLFSVFFKFCQECQKRLKERDLKSFNENELKIFTTFITEIKSHAHLIGLHKRNYTVLIWSVRRLVEEKMVDVAEELMISTQTAQKIPLKSPEINLGWNCIWQARLKGGTSPTILCTLWRQRVEKGEIQPEFNGFILDLCTALKGKKDFETLYALFDVLNAQKISISSEGKTLLEEEMLNYCKEKTKQPQGISENAIFKYLSTSQQLEVEHSNIEQLISRKETDKALELLEKQLQLSKVFTKGYSIKFVQTASLLIKNIDKSSEKSLLSAYQFFLKVKAARIVEIRDETSILLDLMEGSNLWPKSKLEQPLFDLFVDNFNLFNDFYIQSISKESTLKQMMEAYAGVFHRVLSKHPVIEISPYYIKKTALQKILTTLLTQLDPSSSIAVDIVHLLHTSFSQFSLNEKVIESWFLVIKGLLITAKPLENIKKAEEFWKFAKKNNFHLQVKDHQMSYAVLLLLIDYWLKDEESYKKIISEISYLKELVIKEDFKNEIHNKLIQFYQKNKDKITLPKRLELFKNLYKLNENEAQEVEVRLFAQEALKEIYENEGNEKFMETVQSSISFISQWPEKELSQWVASTAENLLNQIQIVGLLSFIAKELGKKKRKESPQALFAFEFIKKFPKAVNELHESVWVHLCEELYTINSMKLWEAYLFFNERVKWSPDATVVIWLKIAQLFSMLHPPELMKMWVEKTYLPILSLFSEKERIQFFYFMYIGLIHFDLKEGKIKQQGLQGALIKEIETFLSSLTIRYTEQKKNEGHPISGKNFLFYSTANMDDVSNKSIQEVLKSGEGVRLVEGEEFYSGHLTADFIAYHLYDSALFKRGYALLEGFMKAPRGLKTWSCTGTLILSLQQNIELDVNRYFTEILSLSHLIMFMNLHYTKTIEHLTKMNSEWSIGIAIRLVQMCLQYKNFDDPKEPIAVRSEKFEDPKQAWILVKNIFNKIFIMDALESEWPERKGLELLNIVTKKTNFFNSPEFEVDAMICALNCTARAFLLIKNEDRITFFKDAIKFLITHQKEFSEEQTYNYFDMLSVFINNTLLLADEEISKPLFLYCFKKYLTLYKENNSNIRAELKAKILNLITNNILLFGEVILLGGQNQYYSEIMDAALPALELLANLKVNPANVHSSFYIFYYLFNMEHKISEQSEKRFNAILASNKALFTYHTSQLKQTKSHKSKSTKNATQLSNSKAGYSSDEMIIYYYIKQSTDASISRAIKYITKNEKSYLKINKLIYNYKLLIESINKRKKEENVALLFLELNKLMFTFDLNIPKEAQVYREVRHLLFEEVLKRIKLYESGDLFKTIQNSLEFRSLIKVLAVIIHYNIENDSYVNDVSAFFDEFQKSAVLIELICRYLKPVNAGMSSDYENKSIIYEIPANKNEYIEINNTSLLNDIANFIKGNQIDLWQQHEKLSQFCITLSENSNDEVVVKYFEKT